MRQYQRLVTACLSSPERPDRTGTGARSLFGHQMRFDLRDGFPLVTSKRTHFRSVVAELLWFLSGSSHVADMDATIWNEWQQPDGTIGPMYGKQWRDWSGTDQISALVDRLQADPYSRRHVVSAWNVTDIPRMSLAPCHTLWQCFVSNDGRLSLQVYQRSADVFLGVPFNIASYALLVHLLAAQTGLMPGELIWTGGDCHIYSNHVDHAYRLLEREPRALPKLGVAGDVPSLFDYTLDDLWLEDYNPHDAIKAPVAV